MKESKPNECVHPTSNPLPACRQTGASWRGVTPNVNRTFSFLLGFLGKFARLRRGWLAHGSQGVV